MPHIYVPKLPANNDTSKQMFFASFGVLFLALLINAVLVRVMWMFRQGGSGDPKRKCQENLGQTIKISMWKLLRAHYHRINTHMEIVRSKLQLSNVKWLVHSDFSQYFPLIFELRTFWVGQKLILHFTHLNSLGSLLKFRL